MLLLKNLVFASAVLIASLPVVADEQVPTRGQNALTAVQQLIDRGHPGDALKQLDALAAQRPEPEGVERLRGVALYLQDDFAAADQAFANALQQNATDLESEQMRGLTLFRLGKPAQAIPLLEHSHQWTATTKVDPSYVLALCYLATRRY